MLQVKDFNFTEGDLVQRKFGGYQITYSMTDTQKTAFTTFLGEDGKEELEVHKWLQDNSIAVVNKPSTLAEDAEDEFNTFESVITFEGQAPLIKVEGEDAFLTVVDKRGTPGYPSDGDDEQLEVAGTFSSEANVPSDNLNVEEDNS